MRAALIPLALTLATPALADEVWTTPFGDAIYEADVADTTILTVPQPDGIMRVYIPGLAGNFDNRGTHSGYWIGTGSRQWGEVILSFDRPGFPTGWTLVAGDCFAPPFWTVRGEARTGG